jgi:hypothetical protein
MDATRRTRTLRWWVAPVLLAAAVALAACGAGASPGSSPTTAAGSIQPARPSSTARLKILSPTNGQVIKGSTVHLRLSLSGARIVSITSTHLKPDEGHVHMYLDNQLISMNYQLDQTIPDVPAGQHVIRVEFVATDHGPFDPRVFTQVVFQVTK